VSYILIVDQPNLGDGGEIFIHGLGTFKNGEHPITDEQEQRFRVLNARIVVRSDQLSADELAGLEEEERGRAWSQPVGTVLGPNLQTAVESMYGVTAREVKDTPSTSPVDSAAKPQAAETGGE